MCILLYFAISVVGTLDLVVLKSLSPPPILLLFGTISCVLKISGLPTLVTAMSECHVSKISKLG